MVIGFRQARFRRAGLFRQAGYPDPLAGSSIELSVRFQLCQSSDAERALAVECVKFFAGFEADGFARGDADFGAGAWIASDAGLAGTNAEDAEAAQLDAITGGKGRFETFKDSIYCCFSLGPWQASPLDHVMDYILLDQCRRPLLGRSFW